MGWCSRDHDSVQAGAKHLFTEMSQKGRNHQRGPFMQLSVVLGLREKEQQVEARGPFGRLLDVWFGIAT